MFRPALAMLAATALTLPAVAPAAEIKIAATNPVIELSVNEVVRSVPDVAQVGAGVMTRAPTASEAVRQNAQQMDRLVRQIRALGIAGKDIQTSNFSLSPNYNYNRETNEQEFAGYTVNNQVNVRLRDLARAGEVLDALVEAGANNVFGPNFMLDDDTAAKAAARKTAFERGLAQASEFARMAGYKGVRLLEVSESLQGFGPEPMLERAVAVKAMAADAPTPIELGEVGIAVTLGLKYEMVN